jgi:iron complex transport system ATP-binding protein
LTVQRLAATDTTAHPALAIEGVRVWTAEGAQLLREIDWTILPGEHWALLGPNGAGKSTLVSVASGARFPSAGRVALFGGRFGEVEIRLLRAQVGIVDPALRLLDWLTVEEIVLTGASGSLRPLPHLYGPVEFARARELMEVVGVGALIDREIRTCSQGERQRVRLARALMPAPKLLLLDEPASGLDLPAREALLAALEGLVDVEPRLATVLVAHHLEELPRTTTHALLLRQGEVVARGSAEHVISSPTISECFSIEVDVGRDDGRWTARAAAGWRPVVRV